MAENQPRVKMFLLPSVFFTQGEIIFFLTDVSYI